MLDINKYDLITLKPIIYVANVKEIDITNCNTFLFLIIFDNFIIKNNIILINNVYKIGNIKNTIIINIKNVIFLAINIPYIRKGINKNNASKKYIIITVVLNFAIKISIGFIGRGNIFFISSE